uniref:Tyrosine-protein phosphatase domain-containing protein n=1 Tax=Caenorhabditis japonica TaxID=281687 RepID=A0A8R1E9V5_CAEJA
MPSVLQKAKKTIRTRSKSNESNVKRKVSHKTSDHSGSKKELGSKPKNAKTPKKSRSNRKRSILEKMPPRDNSKILPREAEPRSRLAQADSCISLIKSIDLEDDAKDDIPVSTPNYPAPSKELYKKGVDTKDSKESHERKTSKEAKDSKNMSRRDKKSEKKLKSVREKKCDKKKKRQAAEEHNTNNDLDDLPEKKPGRPRMKPWFGMQAAEKFWQANNSIDKIHSEYNFIESISTNKTTTAFDSNTQRNRFNAPKIYDDNRIVLNRPGHENVNYINASLITLKDTTTFPHKLIVAQLPRMENESFVEDFWHMIYQEQISLVFLLVPDDILKKAPTKLFKEENGAYQYVGKMFINNRKATVTNDPKEYTIEVLPEGNSDSVMCQVHHYSTWGHLQQPPKTRPIIKMIHQFLSEKDITTAGVCVVSVFGCGRACGFICALIAINQLNKGIVPNICEIMTTITHQRPRATESYAQYAGIYAVVLDYIARKRGNKTDPINKTMNHFIDQLTDISPPSSPVHNT